MTACPDENVLVDWVQGRLVPEAARPLQSHIDGCAGCFRLVAELSTLEPEVPKTQGAGPAGGGPPERGPQTDVVPAVGNRVGRYVLERRLGSGGLGEVFLARQEGPAGYAKPCVVKRLLPQFAERPEVLEQFLHEARLAARLSHPHIAQVHDFGDADGTLFIAMEYVDGATLAQLIATHKARGDRIPLPCAARIISQVASALDSVHHAPDDDGHCLNIVHRDVSTSNIMLTREGAAKLIDFGIAKTRVSENTNVGYIRGNVGYLSPEHARGETLTPGSDIYELGLVFYELLTNHRAISFRTYAEAATRAADMAFEPIEKLRGDLPEPILTAVRRCLAPNPLARYGRASELAEALERYLVESQEVVTSDRLAKLFDAAVGNPPGPRSKSNAFTRARKLAAVLAIVALAAVALIWWARGRPPPKAEPIPEPAAPMAAVPLPPAVIPQPAELEATSELWVESSKRVDVLIDGKRMGSTPVHADVAPGSHTIVWRDEHAGLSHSRVVRTSLGKRSVERWGLRHGTVSFRVIPYAKVFVDEKLVGTTPMEPLSLPEGRHRIRLLNPDNQRTDTRVVDVIPAADTPVRQDLR